MIVGLTTSVVMVVVEWLVVVELFVVIDKSKNCRMLFILMNAVITEKFVSSNVAIPSNLGWWSFVTTE